MIDHVFTSHLKLLLRIQNRELPNGKYMILVAPLWNESAKSDFLKHVTVGIYGPIKYLSIR